VFIVARTYHVPLAEPAGFSSHCPTDARLSRGVGGDDEAVVVQLDAGEARQIQTLVVDVGVEQVHVAALVLEYELAGR
jgi:hypothetical protein